MPTVRPRALVQLFGSSDACLRPLGIRFDRTVFAANLTGGEGGMTEALRTMCTVLEDAGGALPNVARVTAYVGTVDERDAVYGPWDTTFPDPHDRPAFKVLVAPLPAGVRVRLDMLALLGGRRQRIDIPGVTARDPTVRIGDWVMTSRVHGTDPATGNVKEGGLEAEARQAYDNIQALVDRSGVDAADVSQLTNFVRDLAVGRAAARIQDASQWQGFDLHTLTNFVRPSMQLMVEAIAGTPRVAEVCSAFPATPIPDAICIDDLFFAPAIAPQYGDDFESQLHSALERMHETLRWARLDPGNVAHVTVYMPDTNLRPRLNTVWAKWFPNAADRPPHKYVPTDLPPGQLVQLQVFAVRDATRRVLDIPGMAHGDPMSMGVRMADLVFSSRIVGTDTITRTTPTDTARQAQIAFDNVRTLLSGAGATVADLSQVLAFITTDQDRVATRAAFDTVFPGDGPRPRLDFLNAHLPGGATVRLEIVAGVANETV